MNPASFVARARILAFGLALTVTALSAGAAQLRWAAQNDILTLDPHSQNHATTNNIVGHAYEGLVRYDKKYQIEPALATSWQATSPTSWRFNLRKGVKFHDGTDFTADDVIFSFDRIRQPQGTMQIYVAGIKEIRKVDTHTIDVILEKPVPTLLNNLTTFYVMSRDWSVKNKSDRIQDFKAKEETFASRNTNGTGAYVIKEWRPDQRVVMSANPAWWDKLEGNATDILYTPIRADATRIAALLAGDVDLVTDLPTQDVAKLRSNQSLFVLDGPEVRTIFIALDTRSDELKHGQKGQNPFKDARVRQALSMAIDRQAIQRTIMRNLSIPAAIMVAPGVNGHTAELDRVSPANIDGAKKLLAEAGHPNGLEFTLDCPNNRYVNDEEVCQAVVGMWAKLGVKARLNAMPFGPFAQKFQNWDSSAYLLGWGVATYDAQYTLQSLIRTRTKGADGNFNFSGVSHPRVDELVDAMGVETDKAKRDAMIREALTITRDQALLIPLHHQMRPWAMKKSVTIVHNSNDAPKMYYANIK